MAASGAPLADFTDDELFNWAVYHATDSTTDYELIMAACLFEEAKRGNTEIAQKFQDWINKQSVEIQSRIPNLIYVMGVIPPNMVKVIRASALPKASETKLAETKEEEKVETPDNHIPLAYTTANELKNSLSKEEYYSLLTIAVSGGHPDAMRDLLNFFHENYINDNSIKTKAITIAHFLKVIDRTYQLQNCCNISAIDLSTFNELEQADQDKAFEEAITTGVPKPLNFKTLLNVFNKCIESTEFNLHRGRGKTIKVADKDKPVSTSAAEIHNIILANSAQVELTRKDYESTLGKIKEAVKDKRAQTCWNFFSGRDSATVDLYNTFYNTANDLLGIKDEKLRPTRTR